MAGCQDTDCSFDAYFNGRRNGAFNFIALSALKTLKPSATYRNWFAAVKKFMPSKHYLQTPSLRGSNLQMSGKVLA